MFFSKDESEKIGKEIIKNLFFFSENMMLDCNQYIIRDNNTGELSVFDAGNAISLNGLFKGMENLNLDYKRIKKVFLTHEHVDHVIGIYKLIQILKDDPPEIFAYGTAARILEEGDETKILPVVLGITARRFGIEVSPLKVHDLSEVKQIRISSEFSFQIHYTPGHSPGSICFYEPDKKVLIPGDLIFKGGSFGRFDFPGGSLEKLKNSIKLMTNLDVKYLLPGHGGISENGNKSVELTYRMIESMGSYY